MKLLFLFFLTHLPFQSFNSSEHEYYVSVTTVEYSKEQKSLQIISQIFIDDFETVLRKRYDENITLGTKDELAIKEAENYMKRYLTDKLKVKVNGESVKFKFIGKEYKDDITYCYLEVENVSNVKSVEVTNQILFDVFSDQQNIVRLKLLGKNKSFLLVPEKDSCLLNFK
ncbi:hypothetical protein DFQ11_10170 [Winogradskyella epiphytica]|uniref:Peptidase E n=1 Tax=Winogradskyella epiphytica TaxID=262005 RepID=A0A2V4X9B0_9FLAO|nr:DUF6702 family protein [Winogradskyella epiphytica]PYE82645.1 hypothetical protein DFQ11_10170 [Winogradskyella epiphytica]GGW72455.1 hypothetical protein GCM10008085_25880 [Winogradskyella epiphytica]